ncbi:MAG TPA: fibronectin type III domain-containing protein [Candidatus Limnocylindria bacterium]|nr:fibronectin type III domain-containing protein [Candidatus Limnocylindria bacterium]
MRRQVARRIASALVSTALISSYLALPPATAAAEPGVRLPVGQLAPVSLSPGPAGAPASAAQAIPFLTLDPGALQAARLRAAAAASVGSRAPLAASPSAPLVGLFNGLNKGGLTDHMVTPPDTTGAIGPANYVEMVNQQVGVYDRSLTLQASTDLATFMAATGWTVSDPQIQWDGQADRWLYAAVGVATGNNVLLFGWSKTAAPGNLSTGWCRFGIGRGRWLDDYPKLGHDDNFLLVGSNVYDDSVPGYLFVTADVWAIPKPAAGDASCTPPSSAFHFADGDHVLRNQDGSDAFTPVPTNTADASAVGYVVAAHSPLAAPLGPQTKLMLWHVVLSGGSPGLVTDGEVSVAGFDVPAPAPQPNSSYRLDTLDARLTQAVAHADPGAGGAEGIWTQHTVAGPGGRSIVRWYELLPGSPPILRQQGQVDSSTDFVFNAAISPTGDGSGAAIFYNRASSASFPGGRNQLPAIGALSRNAATPLGQMDADELVIGTSSTVAQDFSCSASTPCRWGDYAGASPDPLYGNVVWGSNQLTGPCYILCGFFAQWQTRNFAVEVAAAPPPPPSVPSAPQSLSAIAGDGRVDLAWLAPASDGGAPLSGYEVWRGTDPAAKTLIASLGPGSLTYPDLGLVNGATYSYVVRALNSVGASSDSNEASATPVGPPSAPRNLVASRPKGSGVTLTWSIPLTNGGSPITSYRIYRGTSSGSETLYATVGNVTTYRDRGASNHKIRYYYLVYAVNAVGQSPPSNEASSFGR